MDGWMDVVSIPLKATVRSAGRESLTPGSDLPGGWGFNPPNDFLTPRVSVDLRSWGSILTPVLVLHVSACGASTLSPVGDPPMFLFFTNRTLVNSSAGSRP